MGRDIREAPGPHARKKKQTLGLWCLPEVPIHLFRESLGVACNKIAKTQGVDGSLQPGILKQSFESLKTQDHVMPLKSRVISGAATTTTSTTTTTTTTTAT